MTTLLVPIALDVMLVRATNASQHWALTAMAKPKVGPDQPARQQLLPKVFSELKEPRPLGAYLHWALPDALTRAHPKDGLINLPALPDRWLILRLSTPKGSQVRRVDAWLIPDAGADEAVSLPEALSGPPLPSAPAGRRTPITVLGQGDLAWSAYFDNTVDRFALYDNLVDVGGAVAYLVCGWYTDQKQDPIAVTSESDFRDRMRMLHWTLASELPKRSDYPERSVYHAAAVSIGWPEPRWPGDGGVLAQELDLRPKTSALEVAIGETLAEAIATVATEPGAPAGFAKLLEAKLAGTIGNVSSADGLARMETALHVARFGSTPSAASQEVIWEPPAGEESDDKGAFRPVQRSTPRTWQVSDLSIVVQGGGRNPKHGGDGRYSDRGELVCRVDSETLISFGVKNGNKGWGEKVLPAEPLKGLPAAYGVPAVASALLVELVCLDPGSAPDLAEAANDKPSPVAAARARWWASFDPDFPEAKAFEGLHWNGQLPSPVGVTPPMRPWTPVHLEWEAAYLPSPRGARDWVLGEVDFDSPATVQRPAVDSDHRLVGRTILSASAAQLLTQATDGQRNFADADILSGTLEDIAAQLRGDSRLVVVATDPDTFGTTRVEDPRPRSFLPLRAGFLQLGRLRLVDGFGQYIDLLGGTATRATPLRLGDSLVTPGHTDLAALRPRFTAPARVLFRFVDPDDGDQEVRPGTSPVCGYLVPAFSDGTLELFDASGASWGRLRPDEVSGTAWEEDPGRPQTFGARPSTVLPNALLGRLADGLLDIDLASRSAPLSGSRTALSTFLKILDTTRWATDLTGRAGDEYLSLLLGQPIAVVRATIRVEVLDPRKPPENQSTSIAVRLGTLAHLQDGLLAYYVGDDLLTLHLVDPAIAELATETGEPPLQSQFLDNTGVFYVNAGTSVSLCLLMVPGTDVHITTGLLPQKLVGLQRDWMAAALSRLSPALRFGPVLRDAQATRLPVATGLHGEWLWHRRPTPTSWATDTIVPATAAAIMPDGAARANDGWLQFKLTPDTTHREGQIQFEVISVRWRDDDRLTVDALEVKNSDGSSFALLASQVIVHIESGRFAFFVREAGASRTYLQIVRGRNGRWSLESPNKLAQLPTYQGRRVPNLRGMVLDDARAALVGAGLSIGLVQRRFDASPVNEVIDQQPAAGVEVSQGATIQLTVSDGKAAVVPNVVGQPLAVASTLIREAGLTIGPVGRSPNIKPVDEVLEQFPAAGVPVKPGTSVALTVSDGPTVVVPNVVGHTIDDAARMIIAAGLEVGTVQARLDARPRGEVVAQKPSANTQASPGSQVNLVISDGTAIVVPNVVGQPLAVASTLIREAGLTIGPVGRSPNIKPVDEVLEQFPAAGVPVKPGTGVALTVSDGPAIVVPNVTGLPIGNANHMITATGLVMGPVQRRFDARPVDQVIEQQPSANTQVRPGATVTLVVSNGPGAIVPNVVGQTFANARDAITTAGLVLGDVLRVISARPRDEVLTQQLAAGTQVPRGVTMGLLVSVGEGVVVPNVVGMMESMAFTTLRNVDLVALVRFRVPGQEPAGQVVGQDPSGGDRQLPGEIVSLTVSSGSDGGGGVVGPGGIVGPVVVPRP